MSYWVKQLSLLGFIGIIAYLPSTIAGELFSIVAKSYGPPGSEAMLSILGGIWGFSGLALLLLGVIAIPGELSGLIRPYKRGEAHFSEAQIMSRKVLLVSTSFLAWIALSAMAVSAFAIGRS